MVITGAKTIIRDLQRSDVDQMIDWEKHDNPLFFHYNFPYLTNHERDLWFKIKAREFNRRCYAIEDFNHKLIGYISLRDIKVFRRVSELGIVLDPGIVGEGYGSDAISTFLDYYFNKLKMKKLILRVAKFNSRALKCYEKCGFKIDKEMVDYFEDQDIDKDVKKLILNKGDIIEIDGKLITKYYLMSITKKDYIIHKKRLKC